MQKLRAERFIGVAPREFDQQLRHRVRLLLLHPMAGAFDADARRAIRVQAVVRIASSAPGVWYEPQSLLPAMKQRRHVDGAAGEGAHLGQLFGSVPRRTR